MTRIEGSENNGQVEDLHKEVEKIKKGLKRKQGKRLISCSSCLSFFILVIIALIFFGVYLLALSGLKDIPFFTDKFYNEPEPNYLVNIGEIGESEKDILDSFKNIVIKESLSQKKVSDFEVDINLSDELLTAILIDQVQEAGLDDKIDYIQLAVLDDHLELFIKNKEPSRLFLTLEFKPNVDSGDIDLDIKELKIGQLKLPSFVGNLFIANITKTSLNRILDSLAHYGQIQSASLNNKILSLNILINNINNK